jgi:hypothetical protein
MFPFAGGTLAQRRVGRGRTQAPASKTRFPALTPEQKEIITSLLEYADDVEAIYTAHNERFADKAFGIIGEQKKVEEAGIGEPYSEAIDLMITAYTDLGTFYGRVTDTGLYNSVRKLQELGEGQVDPILAIVRAYGFQGLNTYEVINRLHRLALSRKAAVQQLLARSPTALSKAAATPQPKATPQPAPEASRGTQSVSAELESLAAQSNRPTTNEVKQPTEPPRKVSPLVGSWLLRLSNANGQSNSLTFQISQESSGEKCYVVEGGVKMQLTNCTVSPDGFSFLLKNIPIEGQRFDITFSGRLAGGSLNGNAVASSLTGISVTLPLTGTRIE